MVEGEKAALARPRRLSRGRRGASDGRRVPRVTELQGAERPELSVGADAFSSLSALESRGEGSGKN